MQSCLLHRESSINARQSAHDCTEYGLTNLRLARILATAYRANRASVRVMQKLGMHQVPADEDQVEYEGKEGG
jgi:RimJ/RimL family protein N-acetyltransferase